MKCYFNRTVSSVKINKKAMFISSLSAKHIDSIYIFLIKITIIMIQFFRSD